MSPSRVRSPQQKHRNTVIAVPKPHHPLLIPRRTPQRLLSYQESYQAGKSTSRKAKRDSGGRVWVFLELLSIWDIGESVEIGRGQGEIGLREPTFATAGNHGSGDVTAARPRKGKGKAVSVASSTSKQKVLVSEGKSCSLLSNHRDDS